MGAVDRFFSLLPLPLRRFLLHRPPLVRLSRRHYFNAPPPCFSASGPNLRRVILSRNLSRSLFSVESSAAHHHYQLHTQTQFAVDSVPHCKRHWPEWSSFLESLSATGYFKPTKDFAAGDDIVPDFPKDLLVPGSACLAFARNRPNLLGKLSKTEIEVVVQNGMPFLFKNGEESARKMRLYLSSDVHHLLDTDKANTVDLMKFILSYVAGFASLNNRELVESSVRNLLGELTKLTNGIPDLSLSRSMQYQFPNAYGQMERPFGQNIEMKRGDWICPSCNFMNFARNVKCLECEGARPKRQLNSGEWECPECDFFNYGRSTVCLRCDCKRPGDSISLGLVKSISGSGESRLSDINHSSNADLEKKLADNEEKAQRWLSKLSQMSSNSDMGNAITDEDFPEIMPLRKGVNRFVTSTRKTSLERRLANDAQHQLNSGKSHNTLNKTLEQKLSRSLDEILGRSSSASQNEHMNTGSWNSGHTPQTINESTTASNGSQTWNSHHLWENASDSSIADNGTRIGGRSYQNAFGHHTSTSTGRSQRNPNQENATFADNGSPAIGNSFQKSYNIQTSSNGSWNNGYGTGTFLNSSPKSNKNPQASENPSWSNRCSYNEDASFAATGTQRFGNLSLNPYNGQSGSNKSWGNGYSNQENASLEDNGIQVVGNRYQNLYDSQQTGNPGWRDGYSNQQNASNTANHYGPQTGGNKSWGNGYSNQENASIEGNGRHAVGHWSQNSCNPRQTGNPGWSDGYSSQQNASSKPANHYNPQTGSNKSWGNGYSNQENASVEDNGTQVVGNWSQNSYNPPQTGNPGWSDGCSNQQNASNTVNGTRVPGYSSQNYFNTQTSNNGTWSNGYSADRNSTGETNLEESSHRPSETQSTRSLEGSRVQYPDALDMSEEAKAERWFKRVAQIKDISELSQIPDEDFPSIMPMRKGVNRFVVSKRKTPLERRLASQQYRRNLPTVSSDLDKKKDESS